MMSTKLKVGASIFALLSVAALLEFQQVKIKRLAAENADLRNQLTLIASLQENNGHLVEQLNTAAATSQASQKELMRLRGQAVRSRQLEQENTQLRSQRQQLEHQLQQARLGTANSQPAEVASIPEVRKAGNQISDPRTTDLGMLELSGGTSTRFDLGGGTNCVVTPTALADGNNVMQITTELTNADGTVSELGTSRLTARPGQHCSISVGDRRIALAVRLKTQ